MTAFRITRRAALAGMAALPFMPAIARAEVGGITRLDPALDAVVDANAPIEIIASGYKWAEGPAWDVAEKCLYFSDVPSNIVYRWKEGEGAKEFLNPSGLAGSIPAGIREAGANGLLVDDGKLLLADSGTRLIAAVDLKTKARTVLADRYDGKRFNSCNDLARSSDGAIYFTDPPYGLAEGDQSPLKELPFNGVYRLKDGKVDLIDRSLTRPNGIAVTRGTLFVAISDPDRPEILAYTLGKNGLPVGKPRVFHNARPQMARKLPGNCDGLKLDNEGRVYATGPGGVHVLSPKGKLLGIIGTGKAVANCAFGEDGRTLFLTSSDSVARVRLKARGYFLMESPA